MMSLKTLLFSLALVSPVASYAVPKTVSSVDLSRYLGRWYQIAHKPMWFEGECACAIQDLASGENGAVSVRNQCNDKVPSGKVRSISGTATESDPVTHAKFEVDFGLPWKGTYWIIGLDPDYRYAVVTDEGASSLYILAKTPTLTETLYKEALGLASQQVDTSKVVTTVQTGCSYSSVSF